MLRSLRIRGIGVIDDAQLDFGPGFTALTGETGAGKTMVVTGLTLLMGARLDRGRTGGAATVAGILQTAASSSLTDAVDELGAEIDDGELLVVRRVTAEGRSRAQIGGIPVPIGALGRHIGSIIAIHGQSDQQRLRESDAQRDALDRSDRAAISTLVERHADAWDHRRALLEQRTRLDELLRERDRRGELLREALERIEALDPQPGEEQTLREQIESLADQAEARNAAEQASNALAGEDGPSAAAAIDAALAVLTPAGRPLAGLRERLDAIRLDISDTAAELSSLAAGIDIGPAQLDAANQRLHDLTHLVRDLGAVLPGPDGPAADADELLAASALAARDLDRFDSADEDLERLDRELADAETTLDAAAAALTTAREQAAAQLSSAVRDELQLLEMPAADFRIRIGAAAHRRHGRDDVRFELAPHPGAEHLPVAQGASGGELSRVMLALEVALARTGQATVETPVLVFDEIDAGIGGRAALAVGQRLAQLARSAQVIAVTHLPQVAAHADTHLRIVKQSDDRSTTSTVQALEGDERVKELARMLAGDDSSDVALAHAAELLAGAAADADTSARGEAR